MTKEEAKQGIAKLVEKFKSFDDKKFRSYNESQTCNEFIEPFFEYLGWDMRNAENNDEVTKESNVFGKRVDYAFRINQIPRMFVEAKALRIDLDQRKWAEQAINYSWNKSIRWAVLTDFEGIKVFSAEVPLKNIRENLFFELSWEAYLSNFDQLWLLSKESFEQDLLYKQAQKWGKIAQRKPVGQQLFEDLTTWRNKLTREFKKNNKLEEGILDEGVQKVLDRLIFIKTAEDRKLEAHKLEPIQRHCEAGTRNIYKEIIKVFRDFDENYNSKLFLMHACESWKAENKVFNEIISALYQTKDGFRYDFSAISADVLGGIYEQYLSHVQGKTSKADSLKKSKKKSQGIYYTPKNIVDYIVENTLGEVLKKAKKKDLSKIKILDPACGSGSFLIAAYDKMLKAAEKFNPQMDVFQKTEILKNNIYGVDLDEHAVEIAQLNLLLRALKQKAKLPTLQHNIRMGNSLVSGTEQELEKYFGSKWRNQKPFNFNEEFKEVFDKKDAGFDVIIGNPPYVQLSMEKDIAVGIKEYLINTYKSSMGRLNTFGFFVKQGINLLNNGGYLGFIIPNTILTQDYYEELRKYILDNCTIESIVSFEELPFKDAVVENVVLILKKNYSKQNRYNKKIKIIKVDEKLNFKHAKSITQKLFTYSYKYSFNINLNEENLQLKGKIESSTNLLGQYVHINQAIALKHDRAKYLSKEKISENYKPMLDGRNINRYSMNWDGTYLRYDLKSIHSCKREDIFLAQEKLFFRRVGDRLIATYDDKQFYALNTLVVMNLHKDVPYNIKYILAIFNSKLLNFYYFEFLKSTKKVFSEIQARQVAQLPIKNINLALDRNKKTHDDIVNFSTQMIELNRRLQTTTPNTEKNTRLRAEIEKIDRKIDEEVYKLYGLTKEEIAIIEKSN